MTAKSFSDLSAEFQETDPQDWINNLLDSVSGFLLMPSAAITYISATQTIGTVPANSLIKKVHVVRTTAWDAITTFQVGKSGTADWLVGTAQANVDGAIAAGEQGAVETVEVMKVVTSATSIVLTLNQGAASAGNGYVLIEYTPLI